MPAALRFAIPAESIGPITLQYDESRPHLLEILAAGRAHGMVRFEAVAIGFSQRAFEVVC